MNVKLKDLEGCIDTDQKQLWLMASLIPDGIADKEDPSLNMLGVLVVLIYDLFKQLGMSMETIAPVIMHHAKNLGNYAQAFEQDLDRYCGDEPGPKRLATAFIEVLDHRMVYLNWTNRDDPGKHEDWAPHDMKPEAGQHHPMPPITSLAIAIPAMYLRTIGTKLHTRATEAFCAGVLFKENHEDQCTERSERTAGDGGRQTDSVCEDSV